MTTSSLNLSLLSPKDYSVDTRARIDTLTEELSSARVSDLGRSIQSDFSLFSQNTHFTTVNAARESALSRAETWLDLTQSSLTSIRESSDRIGEAIATSFFQDNDNQIDLISDIATDSLTDISRALTQTLGGRSIFGNGDSTGDPPLNLDQMIVDTKNLAASAADVDSLLDSFDTYFSVGGTFEINSLSDFPTSPKKFPLGSGEAITVEVDAADTGIREVLRQAALISNLPNVGFDFTDSDINRIGHELAGQNANSSTEVIKTQARLGSIQERLNQFVDSEENRESSILQNISNLSSPDAFETSVKLQQSLTQLETIFAITARRSSLNLTNFLR